MFAVKSLKSLLTPVITSDLTIIRSILNRPRYKMPVWFVKKETLKKSGGGLTKGNKNFLQEAVHEKYGMPVVNKGLLTYENDSLLKTEVLPPVEWKPNYTRTGLIGRKLGHYALWLKNGKRIDTTVLQIADNHVIKYIPAGEFNPMTRKPLTKYNTSACLVIGSETIDPNTVTGAYLGFFKYSGVAPKRNLSRFIISPEAAILPGTQLNVNHFRVGDYVDVRGKTVDRGFQGVMRRWGFKGQPASHGVTKTHRRPGSIGGGIKHRVWPGKKMPGHMGNRWRYSKGCRIWRINTKTNTMWVSGFAIPGDPNSLVYIYDSKLIRRRPIKPHFPTFAGNEEELPEDLYVDEVHKFNDPTIFFEPEK